MKNYKSHLFKLSKEELIKYIEISPIMAEKFEAAHIGATHINEVNGADAELPCGRNVEIKTQCYVGNYQLRGRGKYGSATMDIYKRKLSKNEHTVVVGYEATTGNVFYRFSFDFNAIADHYLYHVNSRISRGLGPCNYDAYPTHYLGHDSFKIEFVTDPVTLFFNKPKFTDKFYNFLFYNAITGKIDKSYNPNGKSSAHYKAELWDKFASLVFLDIKDSSIDVKIKELNNFFNRCKEGKITNFQSFKEYEKEKQNAATDLIAS